MKFTITVAGLAALLSAPLVLAGAQITNAGLAANLVVPDRYIVKYKDNVDPGKRRKHEDDIDKKAKKAKKKGILNTLNLKGLNGYVVEMSSEDIKDVTSSELVDYLERDGIVRLEAVAVDPSTLKKRAPLVHMNAAWGLGRISHRTPSYSDYYWDSSGGQNVRVYVVDSGIQTSHTEFEGRAVWGANLVAGSPDVDENGHGTHVAGTVGGKTFGVARKATLVAVKVLKADGSGSYSGIIAGIQWAVSNATAQGVVKKSVINMSVGGPLSVALNAAVKQATDAGMTFVVAAGNSNVNATTFSPASAPSALTVAASDETDQRAWFSNFGASVDIFAPGVAVLSSVIGSSNTGTAYYTGTSMAAPHVAGLAAYFIARDGLTGAAVAQKILAVATDGVLGTASLEGSPNKLAFNDSPHHH